MRLERNERYHGIDSEPLRSGNNAAEIPLEGNPRRARGGIKRARQGQDRDRLEHASLFVLASRGGTRPALTPLST